MSIKLKDAGETPGQSLEILTGGWPRCHIFWTRIHELKNQAGTDIVAFEEIANTAQGIQITNDTIDIFVQYKQRNPTKLVLNRSQSTVLSDVGYDPGTGTGTNDPENDYGFVDRSQFVAGHFIHHVGATVTAGVNFSQTTITVANGSNFVANKPATLCTLSGGSPNWANYEYVFITNVAGSTITVQRAQEGSSPISVTANQGYLAMIAGRAWVGGAWAINYSAYSQLDSQGRSASDVWYQQWYDMLGPGGRKEAIDGGQFDAYPITQWFYVQNGEPNIDINGDGVADSGNIGGVNVLELGLYDAYKRLGDNMPDKYWNADSGVNITNQWFLGVFQGMEKEGWPTAGDVTAEGWSLGMNLIYFWDKLSQRPNNWSYINHKPTGTDRNAFLALDFSIHRLAFAGATCAGAVLTSFFMPLKEPSQTLLNWGPWDEWYKGTDHVTGWLGQALTEGVHLAYNANDTLGDTGQFITSGFLSRVSSPDYNATAVNGNLVLTQTNTNTRPEFTITLPASSGPLFVSLDIRGDNDPDHGGRQIARLMSGSVVGSPSDTIESQVWTEWFTTRYYWRNETITGGEFSMLFSLRGEGDIQITNISVHNAHDAVYREFENGLVVVNPSDGNYVFNLASMTPGRSYRRLQGSSQQDPVTNNGAAIGSTLTIPARDGLFIVATN